MNTYKIEPMPVKLGVLEYTQNIPAKLTDMGLEVVTANLGKAKTANIALLGILSTFLQEFSAEDWERATNKCVKSEYVDMNLKAFNEGRASL